MFPLEWKRRQFMRNVTFWLVILSIVFILFFLNSYSELSYSHSKVSKTSEWQKTIDDDFESGGILAMDDPRVIKKLQSDFLLAPQEHGPLHLQHPNELDPSMGQSGVIRRLLQNKTNGFFIECGALDGETRSNTLYMERFLNWSGLLIEGDPLNFALMTKKNRKAWLSSTCLSKIQFPQKVSFRQRFNLGRISLRDPGTHQSGFVDVQCFPLFSYLLALNISHVDYFSLDVEGDELDVLQTVPFEKVDITTLSVEFSHVNKGKEALRKFMESKNYSVVTEVSHPLGLANDFIFTKDKS